MWVTPTRLLSDGLTIFLELSTFKRQTNNAFRSFLNIDNSGFKNGKAAHFYTNRFSLQAGIKPP